MQTAVSIIAGRISHQDQQPQHQQCPKTITETPAKLTAKITPNTKKTSKREQDQTKKSRHVRKQGLLDFFGKGVQVPAPTKKGMPIEAVTKKEGHLEENSPDSRKRESTNQRGGTQRKKNRSDDKESEANNNA